MSKTLEVICIGALNVDYVATRQALRRISQEKSDWFKAKFETNNEMLVSEEDVNEAIQGLGMENLERSLGGSAYNTARILSLLDVRVGFIGVAGQVPGDLTGFLEDMTDCGVLHTSTVLKAEQRAGVCVSRIDDEGERSLLTWPGANNQCGPYFEKIRQEILEQLHHTRIVHVTSFFDSQTPTVLTSILREAKQRSPNLKISLDPGRRWTREALEEPEPLRSLLDCADFLFLNELEFKELGHRGDNDEQRANSIIGKNQTMVVVLKRYNLTKVFCPVRGAKKILSLELQHGKPRTAEEITDSTGAGDVFSGGFITAMLNPAMGWREAAVLAHRVALKKLTTTGIPTQGMISEVFDKFLIEFSQSDQEYKDRPYKAFIGHGRSNVWKEFRDFFQDRLGFECVEFSVEPAAGDALHERIRCLLSDVDLAFLILTAEDKQSDGRVSPRPNVIHELGWSQHRLGVHRALMLVEEGCTLPSNVSGLCWISFTRDNPAASFEEIRRVMEKEKFIRKSFAGCD